MKKSTDIPVLDTEPRYCDFATHTEIVTGNGLIYASELARAGKTDREIAQALNQAGFRTTINRGSNPFQKDSVRVVLQNRFYVGDLPDSQGRMDSGSAWCIDRSGPVRIGIKRTSSEYPPTASCCGQTVSMVAIENSRLWDLWEGGHG